MCGQDVTADPHATFAQPALLADLQEAFAQVLQYFEILH